MNEHIADALRNHTLDPDFNPSEESVQKALKETLVTGRISLASCVNPRQMGLYLHAKGYIRVSHPERN